MARTYRSTPEPHFSQKSIDGQTAASEVAKIPVVTANPALAGTEASLTGLQVGNTKYAVPQPVANSPFILSYDAETGEMDKTHTETMEAFNAGKPIYVDFGDNISIWFPQYNDVDNEGYCGSVSANAETGDLEFVLDSFTYKTETPSEE